MLQEKIKGCSLEVSELEYDGDMSSSDHEGIMGDRDPEEIPNSNEKAAREKTKAAVEQLRLMKRLPRRWSLPLRMPPLLADFIYCRACKPICAKLLTLPQKLPFVVEKAKKFAIITYIAVLYFACITNKEGHLCFVKIVGTSWWMAQNSAARADIRY